MKSLFIILGVFFSQFSIAQGELQFTVNPLQVSQKEFNELRKYSLNFYDVKSIEVRAKLITNHCNIKHFKVEPHRIRKMREQLNTYKDESLGSIEALYFLDMTYSFYDLLPCFPEIENKFEHISESFILEGIEKLGIIEDEAGTIQYRSSKPFVSAQLIYLSGIELEYLDEKTGEWKTLIPADSAKFRGYSQ